VTRKGTGRQRGRATRSLHARAQACRAVELEEPCEASWNSGPGRRDPASTLRDVAWPKGSAIDDRGGPIVP